MSAHEKDRMGKEQDWIGLNCDANGQTGTRRPAGQRRNSSRLCSQGAERINPSATVWSVMWVLIFSNSPRPCWGCSFHSFTQRGATESINNRRMEKTESFLDGHTSLPKCLIYDFYEYTWQQRKKIKHIWFRFAPTEGSHGFTLVLSDIFLKNPSREKRQRKKERKMCFLRKRIRATKKSKVQ